MATEHTRTEKMPASGPKPPPVIALGPEKTPRTRPTGVVSSPETVAPKTPPLMKFQPQWIPIGIHSERVAA